VIEGVDEDERDEVRLFALAGDLRDHVDGGSASHSQCRSLLNAGDRVSSVQPINETGGGRVRREKGIKAEEESREGRRTERPGRWSMAQARISCGEDDASCSLYSSRRAGSKVEVDIGVSEKGCGSGARRRWDWEGVGRMLWRACAEYETMPRVWERVKRWRRRMSGKEERRGVGRE
jgi:hypothetical protein